MTERITKRVVDATKPGLKDVFVWDAETRGFGLKVTPTGSKVYVLQYRCNGDGRSTAPKRYTIGKHGSPWTPEKARGEAIRLLALVKSGGDPQAQKVAERDAVEQARADSFERIARLFIERYAKPKNKAWTLPKRHLDKHVLPLWGSRPAAEITRRDVHRLLDDLMDAGRPILANRVLSTIRTLFSWAVSKDYVPANPCDGVQPPAAEKDRDRVLSDDELRDLWKAAGRLSRLSGSFLRLLILTGQRRDEVSGIRWSELNLADRTWTIPKERAKNNTAHTVPLSDTAVAILKAMPRVEVKPGQFSDFMFTTTGTSAIAGYTRIKGQIEREVLAARRQAAKAQGGGEAQVQGLANWRFHDIRRTVATGVARMGFPPHVVEKILNHVQGSIAGVALVYNRYSYADECRAALDLWAHRIDHLVGGTAEAGKAVEPHPAAV